MADIKLKAAVLIISDTAFQDPSTDRSGDILVDAFAEEGGDQWVLDRDTIVPDNVPLIQKEISRLCDAENSVNLLITTGGTGFSAKDQTPEAVAPLLHRQAPGLVHGMLAASLAVTPFALMSRPVAGVRNKTLVVTLPGSPKGAKENLLAILKLLPHACLLAAGVDSRALHVGGVKKLEKDAGVGKVAETGSTETQPAQHNHHRHTCHAHTHDGHLVPKAHTKTDESLKSNDLREGASRRHRSSPYPMLSVEEALALILKNTPLQKIIKAPVNEALTGYILAEDIKAEEAVPAYRASIVDGYALAVSGNGPSPKGILQVAAVSHAIAGEIPALPPGKIARITTGAPLPPGATAVVMVEDTILRSLTDDEEEMEVEILTDEVKLDENVREVGSDIKIGELILKKGEEITAVGGELGLLASVGRAEVLVYKKPAVGILSTGDEIVPHNRAGALRLGEVRDCNRPTLVAAVRNWGFEAVDLGITKDESGALEKALRSAMRKVDIIVTTGGVSMGELDLLKPTIERSLGGTIHFGRVAMKPGKPTTFSTVPFKNRSGNPDRRLIFSLPGNPASAVVDLHVFVLPSLQHASGFSQPGAPNVWVTLDGDVKLNADRAEYHRATVVAKKDGFLHAVSTGVQRSSRVGSLRRANALLCCPAREGTLKKGQKIDAVLISRLLGL